MKKGPVEKVFKVNMPRGSNDEVVVDIDKFEDLIVLNEDFEEIRFGDIYQDTKTVVILLRHPQCFTTKEYVEDLATIPVGTFENAGAQLVTVGPHNPELLSIFRKETGFPYKMYCDPKCEIYNAIGVTKRMNPNLRKPVCSKHVKSGWISGIAMSTYRAMHYRDFSADMKRNGGCLILGPGRILHSSHLDSDLFDHRPINSILQEVCNLTMSFPRDQRVMNV